MEMRKNGYRWYRIILAVVSLCGVLTLTLAVFGQGGTGRGSSNSNVTKKNPVRPTRRASRPASSTANDESQPSPTPVVSTPSPAIDPEAVEREHWETIRESTNPQDFRDYLQQYPNGTYAAIARTKLRQLETPVAQPKSEPYAPESENTAAMPETVDWLKNTLYGVRSLQSCLEYRYTVYYRTTTVSIVNSTLSYVIETNPSVDQGPPVSVQQSIHFADVDPDTITISQPEMCGETIFIVGFSANGKQLVFERTYKENGTVKPNYSGMFADSYLPGASTREEAQRLENAFRHAVKLSRR
jgi:hypothetical protein